MSVDAGYPKPISAGFPGVPNNVDAVFKWAANGKMYFFKGSQYWRFESKLESTGQAGVSDKYPRPIAVWKGVPNNIDSVVTYENKRTYFFKGNTYYRFDDTGFKVSVDFMSRDSNQLTTCLDFECMFLNIRTYVYCV